MDGIHVSGIQQILGQMKITKNTCQENLVPFVCKQQIKGFNLESTHSALVIFMGSIVQNTPELISRSESHNISCVGVPPNCTDNFQPLNIAINKSMKVN